MASGLGKVVNNRLTQFDGDLFQFLAAQVFEIGGAFNARQLVVHKFYCPFFGPFCLRRHRRQKQKRVGKLRRPCGFPAQSPYFRALYYISNFRVNHTNPRFDTFFLRNRPANRFISRPTRH